MGGRWSEREEGEWEVERRVKKGRMERMRYQGINGGRGKRAVRSEWEIGWGEVREKGVRSGERERRGERETGEGGRERKRDNEERGENGRERGEGGRKGGMKKGKIREMKGERGRSEQE